MSRPRSDKRRGLGGVVSRYYCVALCKSLIAEGRDGVGRASLCLIHKQDDIADCLGWRLNFPVARAVDWQS